MVCCWMGHGHHLRVAVGDNSFKALKIKPRPAISLVFCSLHERTNVRDALERTARYRMMGYRRLFGGPRREARAHPGPFVQFRTIVQRCLSVPCILENGHHQRSDEKHPEEGVEDKEPAVFCIVDQCRIHRLWKSHESVRHQGRRMMRMLNPHMSHVEFSYGISYITPQ